MNVIPALLPPHYPAFSTYPAIQCTKCNILVQGCTERQAFLRIVRTAREASIHIWETLAEEDLCTREPEDQENAMHIAERGTQEGELWSLTVVTALTI